MNEWMPSALIPRFETLQLYSGDNRSEPETGSPSTPLQPYGEAGTALILSQPQERFLIQLSQFLDTGTEGEAKRGSKTWQRSTTEDKEAAHQGGQEGGGAYLSLLPGTPALPLHAVSHGPRLHLPEERHR